MEREYLSTRAELALMKKLTPSLTCAQSTTPSSSKYHVHGETWFKAMQCSVPPPLMIAAGYCTPLLRGARRGKVARRRSAPKLRPCRDPLRPVSRLVTLRTDAESSSRGGARKSPLPNPTEMCRGQSWMRAGGLKELLGGEEMGPVYGMDAERSKCESRGIGSFEMGTAAVAR